LTKLKLEAEFVSHPDSVARRPIDPAMKNSFGSYSEPGTRNNYQATTSPMVRDDDVASPVFSIIASRSCAVSRFSTVHITKRNWNKTNIKQFHDSF